MFSFRFAIETIRYRSFIIKELVLSLTSLLTACCLSGLRNLKQHIANPTTRRKNSFVASLFAIFNTSLNNVVTLFLECIALLPEIKYYYLLLIHSVINSLATVLHINLFINPLAILYILLLLIPSSILLQLYINLFLNPLAILCIFSCYWFIHQSLCWFIYSVTHTSMGSGL